MGGGSSRLVIPQEETEEERQQRTRLPETINPPEVPLSLIPDDYFTAVANNLNNPALTPILDNFIYGPIVPVNSIQNLSNNEEISSSIPVAKPFVRK